jgi:hypothetical protein
LFISFACPKETNQRKGQKIYTEPSHRPLPDTDIFSCLPTFVSAKQISSDTVVLSIHILNLLETRDCKNTPKLDVLFYFFEVFKSGFILKRKNPAGVSSGGIGVY